MSGRIVRLLLLSRRTDAEKLKDIPVDSVTLAAEAEYERLLDEASRFADTVYYCNVIENFELALQYADSALNRLNAHYKNMPVIPNDL